MLSFEKLFTPIWDTEIVYDESLMMLFDENGIAEAPLLFDPIEIISVTDSKGKKVYEENIDYIIKNGKLRLTENSRIFAFKQEEFFLDEELEGRCFPIYDKYLRFSEGDFFISRQIVVTYICKKGEWKGVRPQLVDFLIPNTFSKLRSGENFNLVVFGDSISSGCNNTKSLNIPPYQPGYADLLYMALEERYGNNITYVNTSCGGKESVWAINNVEERVNAHNPDLVIYGFGMNDGGKTPEEFEKNVREFISCVIKKNSNCDFLLIATTLPHAILTDSRAKFCGNQHLFKERLDSIASDPKLKGRVAVADITAMHKYLIENKRFIDMTSNNVNHPNDFLYRCYANFLKEMLCD